ncbi:MAG: DNA repair protein RecO [Rikenellaceae bacterium]
MNNDYKTTAVVLHTMPHSEKGHIAYLYTREAGRVSYYLFSGKNGTARVGGNRISLQPLSVLSIVGSPSPRGDMHRMKEASAHIITAGIYGNIVKSTIALYLAEFMYRVVKERESSPMLFDFIVGCIKSLNEIDDKSAANFHLYFTINIVRFLGFYPENDYFDGSYFDINLGKFVLIRPQHTLCLDQNLSKILGEIMELKIDTLSTLKLSRDERRAILEALIAFLGHHHETIYRIESLKILSEVF